MLYYSSSIWNDPILVWWCVDFSDDSNGHEKSIQVSTVGLLGIHRRDLHVFTCVSAWLSSIWQGYKP